MTWRTIGPAVTTTAMVVAAWGGIATEGQSPEHRDDDGEQEQP